MKLKFTTLLLILYFLSACSMGQFGSPAATPTISPTEIPCPGVDPKGLVEGMQAYVVLDENTNRVSLFADSDGKTKIFNVAHHIRVTLLDGPVCANESAWWLIKKSPNGEIGWMQVGINIQDGEKTFNSSLIPFTGEPVQREVPEERKREAQIRYIIADIFLGDEAVQEYYWDQINAKPDDPESEIIQTAMDIILAGGEAGMGITPNIEAFERKPFRGGTSVLDAGTDFVQPGLDILLGPCDGTDTPLPVCKRLKSK